MPRMYRSMKIDATGKPTIGRSPTALGVRVFTNTRHNDVSPDEQGNIMPGEGMSVAPAPQFLPIHRVYEGLAHIVEGANATDSSLRIWKMGEGDFVQEPIAPYLELVPDLPQQGVIKHGVIGPSQQMPLQTYEQALANTQNVWQIEETGV